MWWMWTPRLAARHGLLARSTRQSSRFTAAHVRSSSTASSAVEGQLHAMEDRANRDAYTRILSTPLRRCLISGKVLPKGLMFSLVPYKTQGEKYTAPESIARQLFDREAELRREKRLEPPSRIRLLKSSLNRWSRRQAKPSLLKTLKRSYRMALHKSVTAQTPESKARFVGQVAFLEKQINELHRMGTKPAQHCVVAGSTRGMKGFLPTDPDTDELMVRSGEAVWAFLSPTSATALIGQSKSRKRLHALPQDMGEQIRRQLEASVLQETKWLLRWATSVSIDEAGQCGWLVRKLRGQEVTRFVDDLSGPIVLRDQVDVPIAAALLASYPEEKKDDVDESVGERAHDATLTPLYALEHMISDGAVRAELVETMRQITLVLHKKMNKARRKTWLAEKPARDPSEKPPAEEKKEEGEDEQQPQPHRIRVKPRVYVVRQHSVTVDLCVALWRLNAWTSEEGEERE